MTIFWKHKFWVFLWGDVWLVVQEQHRNSCTNAASEPSYGDKVHVC